ncbi:hypothetical protein B0H11DRAFT_2259925 [Mycena galericulata]|nr:hypothetical protein B0H11DRAFT_2259925 [Mycena galericulata]
MPCPLRTSRIWRSSFSLPPSASPSALPYALRVVFGPAASEHFTEWTASIGSFVFAPPDGLARRALAHAIVLLSRFFGAGVIEAFGLCAANANVNANARLRDCILTLSELINYRASEGADASSVFLAAAVSGGKNKSSPSGCVEANPFSPSSSAGSLDWARAV